MPFGPRPTPHKDALLSDDPKAAVPNPWFPIVENAIVHPDEHFVKAQRAFVHYSTLYGSREAQEDGVGGRGQTGWYALRHCAALTEKRLGRIKDGEEPGLFLG